jgi:phytoene dehydrogenase-like protein
MSHEKPAPAPVEDLFDVTIIGAGPVGLFAAFYAGMRGMKTKVIDSLAELGGQLSALYPDKYIFDMAGSRRWCPRPVRDMADRRGSQPSASRRSDHAARKWLRGCTEKNRTHRRCDHHRRRRRVRAKK